MLYLSRHWDLSQDSKLIHYVVFLMRHGYVPYRDIIEINLPGSYLMEWVGMKFFGPGRVGWRCYDLFLTAISAICAGRMARPRGRAAAYGAAALLVIYHLGRGISEAGQRDFEMSGLLMIGIVAFFSSLTARRSWRMVVFGVCCGLAAGIKPFVILVPLMALVALYLKTRREGARIVLSPTFTSYAGWAIAGGLLPAAALVGFLWSNHLWREFHELVTGIALYHRGIGNEPWSHRFISWLPWHFAPLLLVGFYASLRLWPHWEWEEVFIAGLAVFGIATYFYQGKGWAYHVAMGWSFLLIWIVRMTAGWLQQIDTGKNWASARGTLVVAVAVLIAVVYTPVSAYRHQSKEKSIWENTLTADLNDLGGANLSGHIQCLDWNAGCIAVLYEQRWLPATGFIYDYFLFPQSPASITELEQKRFLGLMEGAPPKVIVLSDMDWPVFTRFRKLERWPAFRDWLDANYRLTVERQINDRAYRIYVSR